MNSVERFKKLMSFEPVDRLPIIEWAFYWDKTVERWYNQGLDRSIKDVAEIRKHFGFDRYLQIWISPYGHRCPHPASHGAPIIKNEKQYNNILEHLYNPNFDESEIEKWAVEHEDGQAVVWITLEGFFWHPRTLFGIENHFYAFTDQPKLMHDMNKRLVEFSIKAIDKYSSICTPDFMTFAEDMSYNHGPMLSKQMYDDFLLPYYKQLIPELKKRGIRVFVDSDGGVEPLIPWLKEAGVEGILPLERMAGVDVNNIRKKHPDFLMIGGFDKTVMHLGEEAIRKEFERILPTMKSGGFIPSVDHQTPPEVSFEDYKLYVSILRDYCVKTAN